ncbi:MAG: hypothetical protein ACKVP2_14505 [Burkholderiales bacterium]
MAPDITAKIDVVVPPNGNDENSTFAVGIVTVYMVRLSKHRQTAVGPEFPRFWLLDFKNQES